MRTTITRMTHTVLGIVGLLMLSFPSNSANAQTAFYSFTGDFNNTSDTTDLLFSLSDTVTDADLFQALTYQHAGSNQPSNPNGNTNAAGDTIPLSGNWDPSLRLDDDSANFEGSNNDGYIPSPNKDSWLSWDNVAELSIGDAFGGGINSTSLPADTYNLKQRYTGLFGFAPGPYALDLQGPADRVVVKNFTPNGGATLESLKFGTTGPGTEPARVTIDNSQTLTLDTILTLGVEGNAVLSVNPTGTVNVGSSAFLGSGGILNLNGGTFNHGSSLASNGGEINLTSGNHTVPVFFSVIDTVINIDSGSTFRLDANSFIGGNSNITGLGRLTTNTAVTFNPGTHNVSNIALDLDGNIAGNTVVSFVDAVVDFDVQSIDVIDNEFDGTLNFNASDLTVETNAGNWTIDGELNVDNNLAISHIRGDHLTLTGKLELISHFSQARIHAPFTIANTGNITMDINSSLLLNGPTTFNPTAPIIIDDNTKGIIIQTGDLTVDAHTELQVHTFDLDGSIDTTTTNLNDDLTLNVSYLESTLPFNNRFNGTLNINDNRLTIQTVTDEWTLQGPANITANPTAAGLSAIAGDHLFVQAHIDVDKPAGPGTLFVAAIDAPVTFEDDASLDVDENVTLLLEKTTTFDGTAATYTGLGEISLRANAFFFSNTTIDVDTFNLDGDTLDQASRILTVDGVDVTINSRRTSLDANTFDGILNLNTPALFEVNVTTPAVLPRWQVTGTLNIIPDVTTTATIAGTTLQFRPTSTTNIIGGTTVLQLDAPAIVDPGATFSGPGSILANNNLQLKDGANIAVDLTTTAQTQLGDSPGAATLTNYTAGPSATLNLEAQAPVVFEATPIPGTDHDQLAVTDTVTLDGTLNLTFLDPTTQPILGTEYDVITYTTRAGMFEDINGTIINTDFALAPIFSDTDGTLILKTAVPGDVNLDGNVSLADLSTFALNFNATVPFYDAPTDTNAWQQGDFNYDGQVTVADLSLLALNFGFMGPDVTSPPPGLSLEAAAALAGIDIAAIPEPSTTTLFVLAATFMTRLRRPNTR